MHSAMVAMEETTARERLAVQLADHLRSREVKIPPYPALAMALERLHRAGSTLAEVTAIVETDPALAAAVLRRASTAALRSSVRKAPITLETAIWRLGFDELLQLVFATTLGPTAMRAGVLAPLRRDRWRRSLLASAMCKELAPRRGVPADLAFLAGLLYGFGAVVVVACIEGLEGPLPSLSLLSWRRLIRELENDFGVVLANTWNLPAPIVEAIAHHHTPGDCMRIHRPIVQLVATVDTAIELLDRSATASALENIAGLDHDERYRICALLPRVAEQMSAFEITTQATSASITGVLDRIETWPCSVALTSKTGQVYRAVEIGTDVLVFQGRSPLVAGWLADLFLELAHSVPILANVRSCEQLPDGTYRMTARPYGLEGEARDAWTSIVARGREQVETNQEAR